MFIRIILAMMLVFSSSAALASDIVYLLNSWVNRI